MEQGQHRQQQYEARTGARLVIIATIVLDRKTLGRSAPSSTRFLSYKDQYDAISQVLKYAGSNKAIDIDMGRIVAEGYQSGGKVWFNIKNKSLF